MFYFDKCSFIAPNFLNFGVRRTPFVKFLFVLQCSYKLLLSRSTLFNSVAWYIRQDLQYQLSNKKCAREPECEISRGSSFDFERNLEKIQGLSLGPNCPSPPQFLNLRGARPRCPSCDVVCPWEEPIWSWKKLRVASLTSNETRFWFHLTLIGGFDLQTWRKFELQKWASREAATVWASSEN